MRRRRFLQLFAAFLGGVFLPTSNGQISARDIRQKAIKTNHVVDSAVTTAKIADVAVTVEKTDEPVYVTTIVVPQIADVALTTTETEFMSATVDIPSWVGTISLDVISTLRIRNTSGGAQGFQIWLYANGVFMASGQTDAVNNGFMTLTTPGMVDISTPGASVEVTANFKVVSGTNSDNVGTLRVQALGVR